MKTCVICDLEIKEPNKVALSCGHLYHTTCVITLVRKRMRKCPLCRTKVCWNVTQLNRHITLSKPYT